MVPHKVVDSKEINFKYETIIKLKFTKVSETKKHQRLLQSVDAEIAQ